MIRAVLRTKQKFSAIINVKVRTQKRTLELTLGKAPPTCTGFKVPAIHYKIRKANKQEFESDESRKSLTSSAESTHLTSSFSSISHWCSAAIVNEASLCDLGTQVSSKSIIAPPASSNNHAKLVLE